MAMSIWVNWSSIDKQIENILKNICKSQKENVEYASNLWPSSETPFLWHYADVRENHDENGTWNLWERTIPRILLVDKMPKERHHTRYFSDE